MVEDKLGEILRRQAAMAEAKRTQEAVAAEAAAKAAAVRETAEALWKEQSEQLDRAITELNEKMAANEVQLKKTWSEAHIAGAIECVSIVYAGDSYRHSLRRLNINVWANGLISVQMGTENHSPKRTANFPLSDASRAKWFECLLDFVDIDTPE